MTKRTKKKDQKLIFVEDGMIPSLSYIAITGIFDCAACRLCGFAQRSFGLERAQTGDAAKVLHRPIDVHSSHNEVLRLSNCPVKQEEEEEQTSTLGVLCFWKSLPKQVL